MTDNPSEWAMAVWEDARAAADLFFGKSAEVAAALVIEQAFEKRHGELIKWLRERSIHGAHIADAIERGEYRKDRG